MDRITPDNTRLNVPERGFLRGDVFNTFCVDLFDDVNIGQKYLVNPLSTDDGLANGEQVAYLYNTYGTATISPAARPRTPMAMAFTLANSDYAAALQLAIWDELANGGQASSSSTVFQYSNVNSDTLAQIGRFLADAAQTVLVRRPPGSILTSALPNRQAWCWARVLSCPRQSSQRLNRRRNHRR